MGKKDKEEKASGIFCTPHYLKVGKSTASTWTSGAEQGNGAHDKTAEHAERKAYATVAILQDAKTFCLVTNDFPCIYCTTFFLVESVKNKRNFVLRATSNGGGYAGECGLRGATDRDRFEKTLTGEIYITGGQLYAEGRSITVSSLPTTFVDKRGSNSSGVAIAKIVSAVAQGASAVPLPDVFDKLPALPG